MSGDKPVKAAGPSSDRSFRILRHGASSITSTITDAVVIKDGDLFFLCRQDGSVPAEADHGFGLYHHDCRYLDTYVLHLGGAPLTALGADSSQGFGATLALSNPELQAGDGTVLEKESLGVVWQRHIDRESLALRERLAIVNYGDQPVETPLSLRFHSDFRDIFAIRGLLASHPGEPYPARHHGDGLQFRYHGADGLWRALTVTFGHRPLRMTDGSAHFAVQLPPRGRWELDIVLQVTESPEAPAEPPERPPARPDLQARRTQESRVALQRFARLESDSVLLDGTMHRSLNDLHVLASCVGGRDYIAAGLPWYGALFGRDSAIAAIQMLAFDPDLAASTLYLLAHFQGQKDDARCDEQPGKILHELRVGELAHIGAVPYGPYYGSVDSTPLFLILLGLHARWTGTLQVFSDLQAHVRAAIGWMEYGSGLKAHGYLVYEGRARHGLINQGWKDSGNAIVNADGSLVTPPVAMVEVQGYAYLAFQLVADLYARDGQQAWADHLRHLASDLKARFERDFWQENLGTYALALQRDHRPAAVVASNPGQALWSGIADPGRAARVGASLTAPAMFSGWGVRTLSAAARSYNPIGYHLGTVWPHDNSLIAAGLKRYGLDDAMQALVEGMLAAAAQFPHFRLPELFGGYGRPRFASPVNYPVADKPQAWAAGAVPFLLQTMLGLRMDGFQRCLHVVRPRLPAFVHRLALTGLRLGGRSLICASSAIRPASRSPSPATPGTCRCGWRPHEARFAGPGQQPEPVGRAAAPRRGGPAGGPDRRLPGGLPAGMAGHDLGSRLRERRPAGAHGLRGLPGRRRWRRGLPDRSRARPAWRPVPLAAAPVAGPGLRPGGRRPGGRRHRARPAHGRLAGCGVPPVSGVGRSVAGAGRGGSGRGAGGVAHVGVAGGVMRVVVVFGLTLLAAVWLNARRRRLLSMAVLFLAGGFLIGPAGLGWVTQAGQFPLLQRLAELALLSILFTDGLSIAPERWRRHGHLPGRALLLGLPLQVLATGAVAHWLVGWPWATGLLVGAVLAPTDPVFAAALIERPELPPRLRHLLNVESGLNDGLALPVVVILLGVLTRSSAPVAVHLLAVALGVGIGLALPWLAITIADRLQVADERDFALAIGLLSVAVAKVTGANAFLAAFVSGVTAGSLKPSLRRAFEPFGHPASDLLKQAAVFDFAAMVQPRELADLSWRLWVLVAFAFVAARPLALAIGLAGSGLSRAEWAVAAWFGPRGFASIVYALLVVDSGIADAWPILHVTAAVVLLSMILHPISAKWIARWWPTAVP